MSEKGSVSQKGGKGTNFEQWVATAFLTTLLVDGSVPGIPENRISEIAFQTTNRGYETDDLLVVAQSDRATHRLLIQCKITQSLALKNEKFQEVIKAFWVDYNSPQRFDKDNDSLLIIKEHITADEHNHVKVLFDWARAHNTYEDFILEVERVQVKSKRLDLFREVVKKANSDKDVSDEQIWSFLRCLDLLEYDFLHETSVDRTHFLNLVHLSKNRVTNESETGILSSIYDYASSLDMNGGSVTKESIRQHELFLFFDPSRVAPHFEDLKKLEEDSRTILGHIEDTIGGIHIDRSTVRDTIVEAVGESQLTIVTGRPGAGKSAIVKEILSTTLEKAGTLVFRADQFNVTHLAHVFKELGVSISLKEVFALFSLNSEKIIVIDSAEKLLEGGREEAFEQLLSFIKNYPDIKIIATTRSYAVDLIIRRFKFLVGDFSIIDIPVLSTTEINSIVDKFPQLRAFTTNRNIRNLLESPAYMSLALSAVNGSTQDIENITRKEFNQFLWDSLVKDYYTKVAKGLPAKREDAFMEVAVSRAKALRLFVKPSGVDEEALSELVADGIIHTDKTSRQYAPTHDILEDWALIRYVERILSEYPRTVEFFAKLGTEPAIRRAFRLWVEAELLDNNSVIYNLVKDSLSTNEIENYWADELLIAIFRSEDCHQFFVEFSDVLVKDEHKELVRCIHLIRTACKERGSDKNLNILVPVGSGWLEMLAFIHAHLADFDALRTVVRLLIQDWSNLLLQNPGYEGPESGYVRDIVLRYIRQIEEEDNYWYDNNRAADVFESLTSILFDLAHISQDEIILLFERAYTAIEADGYKRSEKLYKGVIRQCLSHENSIGLCRELPDLVIQVAWKEWKLKVPEKEFHADRLSSIIEDHGLDHKKCWGITGENRFFPPGVYQAPVLNLLYTHPTKAIPFVIEFLNYCVDFYINANCRDKLTLEKIHLKLNDGRTITQWGASELWSTYRGIGVIHNGIVSILMSLEKYLLFLASFDGENSLQNLKHFFSYILERSNNVFTTGVLSSVAMAYPQKLGVEILPLLTVREFYRWDVSRIIEDRRNRSVYDREDYRRQEKIESNNLPHRRKYFPGLAGFILHHQFKFGTLNKEIFGILDQLKSEADGDMVWAKMLTDMDRRNYSDLGDYNEELKGYEIKPVYKEEVKEFVESEGSKFDMDIERMSSSEQIQRAYEGKISMELEVWLKFHKAYSQSNELSYLFDLPVTLAVVGLRDLRDQLQREWVQWCVDILGRAIVDVIKNNTGYGSGMSEELSLGDKDVALESFYLLFEIAEDDKDNKEVIQLIIYLVGSLQHDHELQPVIKHIRKSLYRTHPEHVMTIWKGFIGFSEFRKTYPWRVLASLKEGEAQKKAVESIEKLVEIYYAGKALGTVDFEKLAGYLIVRTVTMIPYESDDPIYLEYLRSFIPWLAQDLKKKENYSYNQKPEDRQITSVDRVELEEYFADLMFVLPFEKSSLIFDVLLQSFKCEGAESKHEKDYLGFLRSVLDMVIYKVADAEVRKGDTPEFKLRETNFWRLWNYLDGVVKAGRKDLLSVLFFNARFLQAF